MELDQLSISSIMTIGEEDRKEVRAQQELEERQCLNRACKDLHIKLPHLHNFNQ